MGKKVSYNALDFQAFLQVLWAGHIQSQLLPNKRLIEKYHSTGGFVNLYLYPITGSKLDGLVKSLRGRHSRERGSPEVVDFPGFPLSRE